MGNIKRIILDVLKPHTPSILEIANRISDLEGISGVNVSPEEADAETDSIKITIEGNDNQYELLIYGECILLIIFNFQKMTFHYINYFSFLFNY